MFLYNIDDLQATVRENLARRASEVARAESIVGEEVDKFGVLAALARRDSDGRRAAPALRAVRRSEVDRLASTLPPEARERVDDITRLFIEKLLLTPTEQLKTLGDAETVGAYTEALTRLFGLARSRDADAAQNRTRGEPSDARRNVAIDASNRSSDRRSGDSRSRRASPT